MSVLLLNPPNVNGFQANRDFMGSYGILNTRPGVVLPPLHLIQMGGCINSKDLLFIDAAAENITEQDIYARIGKKIPDFCIVVTSTPTFDADCALTQRIKEKYNIRTYLFGPHAAHVANEAFQKSNADGILVGYTHHTLQTFLNAHPRTPEIPELILPEKIISPPPIAPASNMNEWPFGCWEATPISTYRFDFREKQPFATMRTSLGCLYDCAYCPYVVAEGQRFLSMSPERIYAEMEYLVKNLGVQFILFRDLLFTAKKQRILELCELLIRKPLAVRWRAETSTQHLTRELLELMSKAGCNGMNLGVESTDEDSSDEMRLSAKRRSLDHVRDVFKWCREFDIKANAMFVFGFPEDSRGGIEASIEFGRDLDAESVQLGFAVPFPGTTLADIAKKENLIETTNWSDYSSLVPVMRTRHLSRDELADLVRLGLRRITLRPKNVLRGLKNPPELLQRAHAFMRFYRQRSS